MTTDLENMAISAAPLTTASIIERLSVRRSEVIMGDSGRDELKAGRYRAAAVLVPLIEHPAGLAVLLTRRSDHLPDHPGQISFPGGRIELGDATPAAAALRENAEEIGLAPEKVRVIGQLDLYRTGTGFEITPIVGLITPPLSLTPDSREVAEIFEVPLALLLNPANYAWREAMWQGTRRHYYELLYQNWRIWGATAGILVNLAERLAQ